MTLTCMRLISITNDTQDDTHLDAVDLNHWPMLSVAYHRRLNDFTKRCFLHTYRTLTENTVPHKMSYTQAIHTAGRVFDV